MPLAWWRAQKSLGLSSSGFCKSVRRGTGDYGGSGSAGSQMEGPHHQRLRCVCAHALFDPEAAVTEDVETG
eukprot:scaffold61609_cov26-Tisochrysis_lutea.AAC.1